MKKSSNYIAAILLLSAFLIFGCAKSKQKKLIGTWDVVKMGADWPEMKYTFHDGDMLVIDIGSEKDTATYLVEEQLVLPRYFIQISGLNVDSIRTGTDGKFRIQKLTKKKLIIHRKYTVDGEDVYVRLEMTK